MSTRKQQAVTYRIKRETPTALVYRNCVKLNAKKRFWKSENPVVKRFTKSGKKYLEAGIHQKSPNNEKIKTLLDLDYTDQNSVSRPRLRSSQ